MTADRRVVAAGQVALVTGANRGLGLEFARQLLTRGARVFAGVRDPDGAGQLAALRDGARGRLTVLRLDVDDDASVDDAVARVARESGSLDLLINNAGILLDSPAGGELGSLDSEALRQAFRTNAIGPVLLAQRALSLLKRGQRPVVASVTSGWGIVSDAGAGWPYAYCASKAALNMLMRIFAGDVERDGVITVLLDPGWVRTDMGGADASLTSEASVRGLLGVIDSLTPESNGQLFDWRGTRNRKGRW